MQELANAVSGAADGLRGVESPLTGDPISAMKEASYKWARASLDVFSGELLRKAMLVSAAIADFANEATPQ